MTTSTNVKKMVRLAIFTAIIVILAFTPLGYLKTVGLEITFIQIPVLVGAILLGPTAGAILGAVFGISSFIQCFGISSFGVILLGINPVFAFITCIVPRVLMGWLCGLIFKTLYKHDKSKIWSFAVSSASAAIMNTVFFMGFLTVLFSDFMFTSASDAGKSIIPYLIFFVGVNGLVELAASAIVGTAVSKALFYFEHKKTV